MKKMPKARITFANKSSDKQNIAEMLLNGEVNPLLAKTALQYLESEEKKELEDRKIRMLELNARSRAASAGLTTVDVTPKLNSGEEK